MQYVLFGFQLSHAILHLLQVLLVIFVWLSVVPLSTCWLWRLGFTRSLSEVSCFLQNHVWVCLLTQSFSLASGLSVHDTPGYTVNLPAYCAGSHYSQIPNPPGTGVCRLRSGVIT